MDIVLLDQITFTETGRFEKHNTLAWNITYPKGGDFQMRSYAVSEAVKRFKVGDIIGNTKDHTVMQVQDLSVNTDGSGNSYVEVSGETPLSVFNYRPAVPKILSTTSYDAEFPDGWIFGDKLDNVATLDPLDLAKEIIQVIDVNTYGQSQLSNLSLPFTYIDTTDRPLINGASYVPAEFLSYFEVSGSVGDVLDELCNLGEFGMVVMRPNDKSYYSYSTEYRRLACCFYGPQIRPKAFTPTFSHLYDDIISNNYQFSLVDNFYIEPREDDVALTTGSIFANETAAISARGLNARVKYETRNIESLDGYEYDTVDQDLVKRASADTSANTFVLDIESNGVFPFNQKVFDFYGNLGSYFLGDFIDVRPLGMLRTLEVRVKQFIRTYDQNGYREYPEFEIDKRDNVNMYTLNLRKYNWN